MTTFENPLIPHARMRMLYRALVETRLLSERLQPGCVLAGLEACWVAPSIDLRDGDLTSAYAGGEVLVEHIRRAGMRGGNGVARLNEVRRTLGSSGAVFHASAADGLLCAVGAASALKAAERSQVIVGFVVKSTLTKADWTRFLRAVGSGDVPLVLVALPEAASARRGTDLEGVARAVAAEQRIPAIPVIPTDAADTIALYRVAQESFVRARAGGGAAIIEALAGTADPIGLLARQLTARGVCTPRWAAQVELSLRLQLARLPRDGR